MVFTADELDNNSLVNVKNESHTWLYKELKGIFEDFFLNTYMKDVIKATPKEIKDMFFHNNSSVTSSFIREVLIDEFKCEKASNNIRYNSLNDPMTKTGQPYFIKKSMIFGGIISQQEINEMSEVLEDQLLPSEPNF